MFPPSAWRSSKAATSTSRIFLPNSTAILLNEAAVATLGVKDPLHLILYNHDDLYKTITYHVVGVVKDFNYNSMHDKDPPRCHAGQHV